MVYFCFRTLSHARGGILGVRGGVEMGSNLWVLNLVCLWVLIMIYFIIINLHIIFMFILIVIESL